MLTSKQRAELRKRANGLTPVFQIGKDGVEEALVVATKSCLAKRELIKLRTLETSPENSREVAEALAEATGAEVVQVIGGTVVLFLQNKKESAFADVLGTPVGKKATKRKTKKPGKKTTKNPSKRIGETQGKRVAEKYGKRK